MSRIGTPDPAQAQRIARLIAKRLADADPELLESAVVANYMQKRSQEVGAVQAAEEVSDAYAYVGVQERRQQARARTAEIAHVQHRWPCRRRWTRWKTHH